MRIERPISGSFWALPPLRRCPAIWGKIGRTEYQISLAQESCYVGARVEVLPSPEEKIALAIDGACLGILPAKPRGTIVLERALPVLDYGPTMKGMIERALCAGDEQQLSRLLFSGTDYGVSFKPLEHYARYYFPVGYLALPQSIKLVNLMLEGVGLIEGDGWYTQEEKDSLLSGVSVDLKISPVSAERMSEAENKAVLAGTVGFSRRWGRPFSDRQFVVIEQLYRSLAQKTGLPLSPGSLAGIRKEFYGG